MRIRKGLILGILATLLLGTVVAALATPATESSATGPRPIASSDGPIVVPTGNVGDRLVYARFDTQSGQPIPIGQDIFVLDQIQAIPDATGASRRALVLRSDVVDENGTRANGMWRSPGVPSDKGLVTEYLDLGTRRTIRVDTQSASESPQRYDVQRVFYVDVDSVLEGLEYQGRELRPFADLSFLEPRTPPPHLHTGYSSASTVITGVPAGPSTLANAQWALNVVAMNTSYGWTRSGIVDMVAMIDGERAIGVRVTIEIAVPVEHEWLTPRWMDDFAGGRIRAERMLWFTATSAYPVLEDILLEGTAQDGTARTISAASRALVKLEPGTATIPWSTAQAAPMLPPVRSGDIIPEDGPDPGIEYTLGEALADIQLNPSLARFEAWKLQHPDAFLVSAALTRGEHSPTDAPTSTWRLTFAENGDGYVVIAERATGSMVGIVRDGGERAGTIAKVSRGDFPADPPSLTAMHAEWKKRVPTGYEGRTPDYFAWGLATGYGQFLNEGTTTCPALAGLALQPGDLEDLRRIEFGVTTLGQCALEDALAEQAAVFVDTRTHWAIGRYVYRISYSQEPLTAQASSELPTMGTQSDAVFRPPTLGAAAIASGSLLAAFLIVYFWPAAKFAGAQLLFIGGYSKIAKSELLEHRVRETLVEAIKQDPGAHASELARRADVGWGTVVYHLTRLENEGLLFSTIDGRHRRFFVAGDVQWTARDQIGVLKNEHAREIYDLILEQPGVAQHELAKHVGMSASNAIRHLRKLEAVGLVERQKAGRGVEYRARATEASKPYDPNAAVEVT